MIVDSHAYCFEPADSCAGFASATDHLRWVQYAQASHHQPAFRLSDRAAGPSDVLAPAGSTPFGDLPDVGFRIDHAAGRVVWTWQGQDYSKHFYPPNLRSCEFTASSLIGEMDYAGVDWALLHTNPMLGRDSRFLADCVRQFPQRLRAMAPVDEWRIATETDAVIEELVAAIETDGLHAIKFNPLHYLVGDNPWDDGAFRPFWEAATSLNVPVFFTLSTGSAFGRGYVSDQQQQQGYLNELRILSRWTARYPDTVCSITHGFPWRLFVEDNRIVLPEQIWEPFTHPNLSQEVCFPVRLGDWFEYPYGQVWPTLELMVERIGADRLMWGTDMPFQNRFCTYQQSRAWIEQHCDFLSAEDMALIMGGTAARILHLTEPATA